MMMICLTSQELTARRSAKKIVHTIATHCDIPESFGKTHFIVGASEDQIRAGKAIRRTEAVVPPEQSLPLVCDGCVKHALFAPDDDVQKILLHLINAEKKSIRLTAYSFTDGEVARALIKAHKRGVAVEIIADPGCMIDRFGKMQFLKENHIIVYVYNPDHAKTDKKHIASSIMHNKFIIFGKNITGKPLLWTGSFNWTKSAHRINQENVLILDDKAIIDKYDDRFELLKKRCHGIRIKKETAARKFQAPDKIKPVVLSKKGTVFEYNEVRI